jgi:nitrogen regulatory protein PII
MKAVFIVYGQSLNEPIQQILTKLHIKGFTRWDETFGRGSYDGEPHYGNHAWPSKNASIVSIMDDSKVEPLLEYLRELNRQGEQQGLNAYVWNIEGQLM